MNPISTLADVYGTDRGGQTTEGAFLDGSSNQTTTGAMTNGGEGDAQAVHLLPGLKISPLTGGLIVLAIFFGAKLVRELRRPQEDFKEVHMTIWFIVAVVLANAAGMPLLRAVAAKYRVPGVSTWILNA